MFIMILSVLAIVQSHNLNKLIQKDLTHGEEYYILKGFLNGTNIFHDIDMINA